MNLTYSVAVAVVAVVAAVRAIAVLVGALRAWRRMLPWRWSLEQVVVSPEPGAMAVLAWILYGDRQKASAVSLADAASAGVGAAASLAGLGLLGWAVLSWRGIFVGHAIVEGHQLVTRGAYGVMRHPAYTAALLMWAGLAVAFQSLVAAAVAALYVLPSYIIYARAEEEMLLSAFGDEYRRYKVRVPGFVPRLQARGGVPAQG